MDSIEKSSIIRKEKLNGEFYFQSLIEEAYSFQMIGNSDIERLQYECLELLANRAECYNGDQSSSIRIEAAQNIMASNLYTIGLALKSYLNPDDAVIILKGTKISELYANGRKRIDTLLKVTKALYSKVINNMIETDNTFYNGTVVGGIKGFFKIYNPEFEAHEIHITADYPLCNPIQNTVGIEFIQKYLEAIYYENMFCRNFLSEDIHHLLYGYDKTYQDLLINIYEPILTAALGCILTGKNVRRLVMTKADILYLNTILKSKSKYEIRTILLSAFKELKRIFPPTGTLQEQYLQNSLQVIASRAKIATELNTVDKVFLIAKYL